TVRVIRTRPRSPALQRMRLVDMVIRDLVSGRCDPDEGVRRLDVIFDQPPPWGPWTAFLAFMLTGAGVALLSGGTMSTALAASVAAAGVSLMLRIFGSSPRRAPLADFVAALVAALLANLLVMPLGSDPRLTLIAAIIVLIPGLTLTIAMRELAMGELTAGSARLMGALTTFVALGFGAGVGEGIGEMVMAAPSVEMIGIAPSIWTLLPAVCAAAIGLMILLGEDPRMTHWFLAAVLLGWGSIQAVAPLASPEVTAAIAALAVGLGGNVANRLRGVPTALVAVPGLIVLVPGALGLAGFQSLISDDPIAGLNTIIDAMLIGGGLVAGLLVAAMLVPPRTAL
ncbi:MAG: threonine/serine exporter family protein, partial [Phycisphaerales bacterium]|nr:threonine/serine exporter family protein [Phycisphaerales bacterium]